MSFLNRIIWLTVPRVTLVWFTCYMYAIKFHYDINCISTIQYIILACKEFIGRIKILDYSAVLILKLMCLRLISPFDKKPNLLNIYKLFCIPICMTKQRLRYCVISQLILSSA